MGNESGGMALVQRITIDVKTETICYLECECSDFEIKLSHKTITLCVIYRMSHAFLLTFITELASYVERNVNDKGI